MDELVFPDGILYHPEHTWLKMLDDATALVGISDFAQQQLGEVAFVDLPAASAHFSTGEEFGVIESVKAVSSLHMPVSGTVTHVNDSLVSEPSLVNASPYEDGWMVTIVLDPGARMEHLLSGAVYAALLR
jgi:glycine cleavage system H protein